MGWLRARQISRSTDYRHGPIPERSVDPRRCGRRSRAAISILITWSPSFLLPTGQQSRLTRASAWMRLYRAGFELSFPTAPITVLSGTWTVPDLNHSATPETFPNHLHTFFGLGFLDVHVAVAVDAE